MVEVGGELKIASNNYVRDPGKDTTIFKHGRSQPWIFSNEHQRLSFKYNFFCIIFYWELLQPWSTGLHGAFRDDKLIRCSSQPINYIINHQIAWKYISLSLSSLLSADVYILLIWIILTDFSFYASFQTNSFNTILWGRTENIHDGHEIRNQRISALGLILWHIQRGMLSLHLWNINNTDGNIVLIVLHNYSNHRLDNVHTHKKTKKILNYMYYYY